MGQTENRTKDSFEKIAVRVSKVSIVGNVVLSLLKLLAGIIANSSAMVSDAIHSASDVFSSVVVIIGVRLAAKESDEEHPYGHERMESVAAVILSVVLAVTGLFIGYDAIGKLTTGAYESLKMPGMLAAMAAVFSIVVKEAMYWYTRHFAVSLDSGALMADAWHHRSDALSSIGSLVGIVGARMGYLWFDPLASLIICLFILKAAVDIFSGAINQMVDRSCSVELQEEFVQCAGKHPEVSGVAKISTREFGNRIYVDLSVYAKDDLPLACCHSIAHEIHDSIEETFPKVKHINVWLIPESEKNENHGE